MNEDYGFVVVHVPHASIDIPQEYRDGILLDDQQLLCELRRMTDAFCDELYDDACFPIRIIAKHSRFVCDVERFRDDSQEHCAKKGQGLMYTHTTKGKKLREYDETLRAKILREIYDPHHERLTAAVEEALNRYNKCLIIDGHSFNSRMIIKPDNILGMPDFDIGTDTYHTPPALCDALCRKVHELGYKPKVNSPFGGAITPMKFFQNDKRVMSVMFETNRRLYMNEADMTKTSGFDRTRETCRALMRCAAEFVNTLHGS